MTVSRARNALLHRMRRVRLAERNTTNECECGGWKSSESPACHRCTFLDDPFEHPTCRAIIELLRDERYLSLYEIAADLGLTPRNTLRWIVRLRAHGRLATLVEEVTRDELDAKSSLAARGCADRNIYRLTDARRAA